MVKPKVILRADGNAEIGLGHVMRTLALAEILRDDFECIFATRFTDEFIKREIEKVCFRLYKLPEDDFSHFEFFLNSLEGNEIVVLDNYYFTTDYQKKIKRKGSKLICIDDLADRHFVSDVVINHSPGSNYLNYSKESYTRLALGLDFALIRSDFYRSRVNSIKKTQINHILISLGNTSPIKLLSKILEFSRKINIEKITVLSSKNSVEPLSIFASGLGLNVEFKSQLNASELIGLLNQVDLAILPASTICFEAISQNTPIMVGYFVDNQKNIYDGLLQYQDLLGLGDFNIITEKFFLEQFTLYEKQVTSAFCSYNLLTANIIENIKQLFEFK